MFLNVNMEPFLTLTPAVQRPFNFLGALADSADLEAAAPGALPVELSFRACLRPSWDRCVFSGNLQIRRLADQDPWRGNATCKEQSDQSGGVPPVRPHALSPRRCIGVPRRGRSWIRLNPTAAEG